MKRTPGGARSYRTGGTSHKGGGNGLTSSKGGLKVPPSQTDTTGQGAIPNKSWKSHGANVVGSRLPGDGKPRR